MRQPLIWPVYGRQNGPKSPFSEVRRATLQTSPRLFGQFQRNCLINSWRALSTLVLSDTRRPNRAPSHRSTPWWDPRIGPVSIYQTVSRRVLLGNRASGATHSRKLPRRRERRRTLDLSIGGGGCILVPLQR